MEAPTRTGGEPAFRHLFSHVFSVGEIQGAKVSQENAWILWGDILSETVHTAACWQNLRFSLLEP